MFKPISKSDDKQQKISKLVIYISNFKVLTDPLKTFHGPPGVRGPPVENHWARGFLNYRLKYYWPKVIYCICLGLSDGRYFTGLAGILLLI